MQVLAARSIAAIVAYDGTNLCGSQRQSRDRTVQGDLESALHSVTKCETPVVLAGRTDAGVHATGQVFRFQTENRIPAERVSRALNTQLQSDIRVQRAWECAEDFHPRFDATGRVYRYSILDGTLDHPLLRQITGRVRDELDENLMGAASAAFVKRQDFAAWQSAGSPTKTTVREVRRLEVVRNVIWGVATIDIEIEADAFLYQMVRNIVGALIEAGRGNLTAQNIAELSASCDRRNCPPPAPPSGLCLVQVKYHGND